MTCVARPDPRAEVDHLEPCLLAQLARERVLVRLARARARRPAPPRPTAPGSRTARAGSGRPDRARPPVRPGAASSQRSRGTPGTSAAARPRAPRRSRARSKAARRAPSRRGGAPGARAPAARRTRRDRPPCRRSRSRVGAARRAIRSSRSAEPAKSRAAQVARAWRRPVGGVRDADPELQQLELLARVVEARREAGGVQQPPEVVARVGEVGVRGGRDAAGVDPAEDRRQPGREDVRDVALRRLRVLSGVELLFKERSEQLAGDGRLVARAPLRRR